MSDNEMEIVKRKAELAYSLLKEGSIETANDRAALYAATRILFDDISRIMKSVDATEYQNYDADYVVSQLMRFKSCTAYYLGLADYTDVEPGGFENVQHFALKFIGFIPSKK